jgi:diguanylate cyclase (GGDEF)-like protein
VCERIRAKIAEAPIEARDGTAIPVTASIGVTTFRPGVASGDVLIGIADQGLYAAKEGGRNRVVRGPLAG